MTSPHTPLQLALLNDWQHDFPLVRDPFRLIADRQGVSVVDVLQQYRLLSTHGVISRIGGVWGAGAGGAALLCAMRVPSASLAEVAELVSHMPGVNHNYEREHDYNLWFVMTGRDRTAVEHEVTALERRTGYAALRLPMQRVYRIDLGFDLKGAAAPRTPTRLKKGDCCARVQPREEPLAALIEQGLDIVERPYDRWASMLGWSVGDVWAVAQRWRDSGTLRRFGVVVRHHEVGYDQNAMTVIDVPDEQVDLCAARLARQAGITLCYRRARADGWPYNLYCMVHGREREGVQAQIAAGLAASGLANYPRAVLFSRRRFKQTGARYFRDAPREWAHAA